LDVSPQFFPVADHGLALYEDEQHTPRGYIPLFGKSGISKLRVQGAKGPRDQVTTKMWLLSLSLESLIT
jgi:hypothetical protein